MFKYTGNDVDDGHAKKISSNENIFNVIFLEKKSFIC